MKSKYKFVFVFGILIGVFLIILTISQLSSALEPKLLWKREIRGGLGSVALAKASGDVIFTHGPYKKAGIVIIDKNGNTIWQWGPNLERGPSTVSISDDGRYFVYDTDTYHESDMPRKPFIHYIDRNKGESWKKGLYGTPNISSDGKYVFVAPGWENWKSYFLDSAGNILWKKSYGSTRGVFSPDGNFLWDGFNFFDKSGNSILRINLPGLPISISENLEYIAYERMGGAVEVRDATGKIVRKAGGIPGAVINKNGSILLEGKARISENGKTAIIYGSNKTKVYKLPEKTLVNEYPIRRYRIIEYSDISYDGNIIVILGERTDRESSNNLFIIDISKNELCERKVEKEGLIFITKDGRYFLIESDMGLYFYEILN